MLGLGVKILTLCCLSFTVNGVSLKPSTNDSEISERNLVIIMQKLEALDKKIDGKLQEFGEKQRDAIMEIDEKVTVLNHKLADTENKMHEMKRELMEIKSDMTSLKQASGEEKDKDRAQSITDVDEAVDEVINANIEKRVGDLESEMSDIKLSLNYIADDVNDLQQAGDVQNTNIIALRQQVCTLSHSPAQFPNTILPFNPVKRLLGRFL